jgi:hypothetical protein
MSRALCAALLLCACLDPGKPYLATFDTKPPSVVLTKPASPDGGVVLWAGADPIVIRFDEEMEPRSLRPGIAVLKDKEELQLTVIAPAPTIERFDPPNDRKLEYEVVVTPVAPFVSGVTYRLVLRTILSDTSGNPLPEETRVFFKVQ